MLEGGKASLPGRGDKAHVSSNAKVRRVGCMHEHEIAVNGAAAKQLPHRASHIMLRSLFKRQ